MIGKSSGALVVMLLVLVGIGMSALMAADNQPVPGYSPQQCDPATVVGHETCIKCHEAAMKQWMQTPHYRTFDALHRTPEAKQIADKMGLRSIKRNDTCVTCHYTRQVVGNRERVVAGVSCESCHGGAKNWLDLHADYGGPNVTREMETAAHREQRLEASIAAGMNNPENLYLVARQCLSCHTVPDEKLVNVGGHKAGTDQFELVAWSQGLVRHNFVRSGGATNAVSSPERLRVMYVVGQMADLEASLRATAKATEMATYGQASAGRAARAKSRLWEVQRRIDHPLLGKALDAVATLQLTLDNQQAMLAAADQVAEAAYEFATVDGSTLQAIDRLLPAANQYKN
ncbi:cytochrome c family protein [Aeoliella mucimassa]|uniref:Perchlorate reductase subunit gamma n=1 Tax=Aeoliella mucimassa TaxID=2527972 RepID=A0A518AKE8_9BACT|nr:cytochrome c family protein [Aeoliella mucimassa]QDU55193.1 Perchlorate reductase subunit gamma precursor [Aeoliella mucimassa]